MNTISSAVPANLAELMRDQRDMTNNDHSEDKRGAIGELLLDPEWVSDRLGPDGLIALYEFDRPGPHLSDEERVEWAKKANSFDKDYWRFIGHSLYVYDFEADDRAKMAIVVELGLRQLELLRANINRSID